MYAAEFRGQHHSEDVLNAICMQRNAVRRHALESDARYRWLFFLDSGE